MQNDPTPQQIAEACRRIQADWDEAEFYRRAGCGDRRARWSPPETRLVLRSDDRDEDGWSGR